MIRGHVAHAQYLNTSNSGILHLYIHSLYDFHTSISLCVPYKSSLTAIHLTLHENSNICNNVHNYCLWVWGRLLEICVTGYEAYM